MEAPVNNNSGTYVPSAGMGALFAHASRETGEIERISGRFVTPEGVTIVLDAQLGDDGLVTIVGHIAQLAKARVSGFLAPDHTVDAALGYKRGEITVQLGKKTNVYKLNSKPKEDRNGLPYRLIWLSNNRIRVAF